MIDGTGMPQSAIVIGGASDIAREVLRLLAARRLRAVVLGGRSQGALEDAAQELRCAGVASVVCHHLDVTVATSVEEFVARATTELGEIDLALMAAGQLGSADLGSLGPSGVEQLVSANFSGPAAALAAISDRMVRQGYGRIVVLSSVAGQRPRRSNFVYGAAKAGLDGFARGLSASLAGTGVAVCVVRPGFVRTKMTEGMKPAAFAVDAATVADAIVSALETGREVVWVPRQLRYVFAVLRVLPEPLWKALSRYE